MQLHRTTGKPDWATVNKSDQNIWQCTADSTNGLVTPGNIITLLGFVTVLFGLSQINNQHFLLGGIALAAGRLLDIADGWIAEITKTKSSLGELLDASADKLATGLTLLVFYLADVVPGWILLALLLPHLIITILALVALKQNRRLHPSAAGKLSMAGVWLSLLGFLVTHSLNLSGLNPVAITVNTLAVVSIGLGLYATAGYASNRD